MDIRLTYDISRKLRQPMASTSADAANCYDRINHMIMSPSFNHWMDWHGGMYVASHPDYEVLPTYSKRGLHHILQWSGQI